VASEASEPIEYTKITLRHLRRAEDICRRRLALETAGQYGNRGNDARFGVPNRVTADVRLAHTDFGPPDTRAFVVPGELLPEQQRVYGAAVSGYLALFGEEPGRTADLGFDTVLDEVQVRLVGDVGVALDTDDGCEVRVLRVVEPGRPLLDDVDLRFTVVRVANWATGRGELRIVAADLLNVQRADFVVDVDASLPDARAWVDERVALVRELIADPEPRAGQHCLGCGFVSGCKAHR
jgi:hypothetical protein